MKHLVIFFTGALIALSAATFLSCNSNKPIPDDLTAKELIQRGQEAFEKGRNKQSLRYFNAVVERYGSDPALYTEATYEIGHLHMRNKNYTDAVETLEGLTKLYASHPVGTFPPAYEKLAKLELEKIPEDKKEAARKAIQEKAEKLQKEKDETAQREQIAQDLEQANKTADLQTAETEASAEKQEQAQEPEALSSDATEEKGLSGQATER